MKRFERAFTLVELMMVITIIAILSGVLISVSLGSIRAARSKRTEATQKMFDTAIATYYAQEGKWPQEIETKANNDVSAVLVGDSAQGVLGEIVKRSSGKKGTIQPLLDPTGLFVARKGIKDGIGYGLSFNDARAGDGGHRQKIGVEQMVFGFQGRMSGKFRRFNLIYHAESDSVEVSKCCEHCIQCEKDSSSGMEKTCKAPYKDAFGNENPKACPYCHKIEKE